MNFGIRITKVEIIKESKVKFFYPCGHTSIKDYSKGPVSKRIPSMGIKMLVGYWNRSGVYGKCPKCNQK